MQDRRTDAVAALGLDAGGSGTRWALAGTGGAPGRGGEAPGLSGAQLHSDDGRAQLAATLAGIAAATGPVRALVAGITGFDAAQAPAFAALAGQAFAIAPAAVRAMSDIELICHAAFAPGAGYVVCAGTGSIAAFIDGDGTLQRAGGRGPLIDDGGSAHWIACQALRRIWRAEDEAPGSGQASALGRAVFAHIGGSSWDCTRRWVQTASRGQVGLLARAVAAAADEDAAAMALLQSAGTELARLAQALITRHGPRPLALAGRVFDLHPAVEQALRAALPAGTPAQRLQLAPQQAAARLAAGGAA